MRLWYVKTGVTEISQDISTSQKISLENINWSVIEDF